MKKTPFLMALLLFACQASPPVSQPNQTSQPNQNNQNNPGNTAIPLPADMTLPGDRLESARASISSSASGDALSLKVVIQRPEMRLQAFDLTRIKFIRALVKGADIQNDIRNQDGFVPVQATESSLRVMGVPKGKNRIVVVQAYGSPLTQGGEPQLLDGVVLKAIYSSVAGSNEVEVRFTLQSTLAASVLEQLLQTQPVLAGNIDATQLAGLVNNIATGSVTPPQNPFTGLRVPPGRLDPTAIATQIANEGQLPVTPTTTIPPAWFYTLTPLTVIAQNPAATTFNDNRIVVQVTDPVTQAMTLLPNQGSQVSFAGLPPGNWEVVASLQDSQNVIRAQERLNVYVPPNGGAPVITNANGQVVPGPVLTLPPLLTGLRTEQGTAATQYPAGSTVVIRGDGFNVFNPANNIVTVGGQVVPLANLPVTGTSLAIVLPATLAGQNLPVVVTTNGKPGNSLTLSIDPAIVALDRQSVNGTLPANDSGRQVVISTAGFDPTQDPDLRLQFRDTNGNLMPALVTPAAKTATTITVNVPVGAGTGVIDVIRSPGAPALATPKLTVLGGAPDVTSTNHVAGVGSTFTLTGLNFAPGSTAGTQHTTVMLGTTPLPASAYKVIDAQTIEITVPRTGFNINQSYPVEVCVNLGTGSLGCDSTTVNLLSPPVTALVSWNGVNNPISLIGQGYVPGQTTVTIGGVPVPPANLTINGNDIQIANPPADAPGKTIQVTTPYGTTLRDVPLYADLINFIGNSATTYLDGVTSRTASAVNNNLNISDPHGIAVDGCEAIYVVGNGTRAIQRFNLNGTEVWRQALPATSEDVGVATDGTDGVSKVYVAATSGNRIDVFSKASGFYLGALQLSGESIPGPEGLEVSADGQYLYVSSNSSPNSSFYNAANKTQVVRIHIASSSIIKPAELVAGGAQRPSAATGDETIATAKFNHLEGLGMDGQNNIYVAEADFRQIRKISPSTGLVTVLATLPTGFIIHEIRVEPDGSVIVPGENSQKIYRISPAGAVTTVAGTGGAGLKPGAVATSTFSIPVAVDFDNDGNVYIADRSWGIRKINRFVPRSGTRVCP